MAALGMRPPPEREFPNAQHIRSGALALGGDVVGWPPRRHVQPVLPRDHRCEIIAPLLQQCGPEIEGRVECVDANRAGDDFVVRNKPGAFATNELDPV